MQRALCLLLFWVACLAANDRAVAIWVLEQGGRVLVEGQPEPITHFRDLPAADPLWLRGVDLYGTIIEPKDLEKLSTLTRITELYLPGPSWNPGAGSRLDANAELRFLSPLRTLEKLHFSLHFLTNVNVQDKGLEHLKPLTALKELRLSQGRIQKFSLAGFTALEGLDLSYSSATDEVLQSLSSLPKLKRLNLRDTLITDAGLAHLASIPSLEELDLYGMKITDRGVQHLARLKNLRRLNLLGGPITDSGAEKLATLSALRELNLYRAELTNAGAEKLAALSQLERLDLRYTRVTASGVERLRRALPRARIDFSGLVEAGRKVAPPPANPADLPAWIRTQLGGTVDQGKVQLARTPVTDDHLKAIARLPGLTELDLEGTEIGDLGLEALATAKTLRILRAAATTVSDRGTAALAKLPLETLDLSGTLVQHPTALPPTLRELHLASTAVNDLAFLQSLPALRHLSLAYTDFREEALAALPPLASLDLTGTDVGDPGLAHLARLTSLQQLRLNHARFTEKGFAQLAPLTQLERFEAVRTRLAAGAGATLAQWPQLKTLKLDYTTVTDAVLEAITKLPLVDLELDSTNITDSAVTPLAAMKTLRRLNLYHTLISEDAHNRLRKALPQTTIIWDRDSKLPNRRGS